MRGELAPDAEGGGPEAGGSGGILKTWPWRWALAGRGLAEFGTLTGKVPAMS